MSKLFSPDSGIPAILSRCADLIVLNLLFLLTCIPLFTIGPALAALYTVTFAMGTHREQSTAKTYFRAFRKNFWQALQVWIAMIAAAAALALAVFLFLRVPEAISMASVIFMIPVILLLLALGYVFPLVSLFENSVFRTLKNAVMLSLGHLPVSAAILAINCFPLGLYLFAPWLLAQTMFLFLALYFSAAAFLNSLLLRRIMAPFLPEGTFAREMP